MHAHCQVSFSAIPAYVFPLFKNQKTSRIDYLLLCYAHLLCRFTFLLALYKIFFLSFMYFKVKICKFHYARLLRNILRYARRELLPEIPLCTFIKDCTFIRETRVCIFKPLGRGFCGQNRYAGYFFWEKQSKLKNQQIIGMHTDYLLISHHDGLIQFRHIQYQCLWQPIFHALVPMERLFL